jgi:ParB-like chromosome segregation protein Spo0J
VNRAKIKVEVASIQFTPHRGKVGDLRPLTQYFQNSDGELLAPAVVRDRETSKYVVVGGERRLRAAIRAAGGVPIYVVVCDVFADWLAWAVLDKHRENPAHPAYPISVTDVVRVSESLIKYLSPGRDEHLDDTLGEYYNVKPSRIGEARSIKRVLDRHNNPPEIQKLAEEEWAAVADGTASPSAAFQRIRKAEIRRETPPSDARVQRQKLTGAAQVATGLVDALGDIGELSPDLLDAEVALAIARLGDGRRVLDQVIRKAQALLAERKDGTS